MYINLRVYEKTLTFVLSQNNQDAKQPLIII